MKLSSLMKRTPGNNNKRGKDSWWREDKSLITEIPIIRHTQLTNQIIENKLEGNCKQGRDDGNLGGENEGPINSVEIGEENANRNSA